MILKNKFFKINILTMLIVSFLAVAAFGQETAYKPVAEEMIGASGISWAPTVSYSQLVLTISRPDGTVFSTTFESGKTPYIDLGSILGSSYSDGSYTYELRVIPSNAQKFRSESDFKAAGEEGLRSHKALTQSGYFFIRGGAIVTPGESEPGQLEGGQKGGPDTSQEGLSGTSDICYVDDLIVDGSLCVGFDCTCNYSFGFDTIVLKENNLRIFFDDTSVGSFPSNNWRIIINDSASGGASYFGVEDSNAGRRVFTLEAGAPSHSLYVDDGGRVGFGTSTPVLDLHVKSGNTPALRLEQDGSSGFSPQTWDVAGNETNFFVRDATNGSQLPFKIRPGADSNSLVIDSDNDIGIGTLSPKDDFSLELKRTSGNAGILINNNDSVEFKLNVTTALVQIGSRTNHKVNFVVNNAAQMTLDTNGYLGIGDTTPSYPIEVAIANGARLETSGNWVNPSSRELKENIQSLTAEEAEDTLAGLNPVKYNYKVDKTEGYVGFIAEDVPELVAVKDRKGLVTMDVVAVLTKVVQEQQKSLKEQQESINQQKKVIADLNKRIAGLEKDSN
jgi:hypothetical protein